MMHPNIARHGSLDPLPPVVPLTAGRLSMLYEAGFLRYIKVGDVEVVRMINHLIRDQHWGTIPMRILSEQVESGKDSFSISYKAECVQNDIHFDWTCHVKGNSDSSVVFSISGVARRPFLRNRLGLTVLHPIETTAGKSCLLTHADDSTEALYFPELISPHQPFVDVKAMQWEPAKGIEVSLKFEGDLFETEDQRNWLDSSFKTYCTPLVRPHPHQVNTGDVVEQIVRLSVSGDLNLPPAHDEAVSFEIDRTIVSDLPRIGIVMNDLSHDEFVRRNIRELGADFIRIVLRDDYTQWQRSLDDAVQLGMPLEVALVLHKETPMDWIQVILPYADKIVQFIVLTAVGKVADGVLVDKVVPVLRHHFPQARIGSGSDIFFTELNRERTPAAQLDFLSFPVNPQAHAQDWRTMAENMVTHRDVVSSCRAFSGKDVHVGPVTLRTRLNPSSKSFEQTNDRAIPSDADPRILSMFGAAWTIGSFKYLAESGAKAITYFETCGWRGLMEHSDQPWPATYQVAERVVHPVYIVLREILSRKDRRIGRLISSSVLQLDGMVLIDRAGKETVLLANVTDKILRCKIPAGVAASYYTVLSAEAIAPLLESPLKNRLQSMKLGDAILMEPFSIAIIE